MSLKCFFTTFVDIIIIYQEMKIKHYLEILLVMAGLTACNNDNGKQGIGGTEWYGSYEATTITDGGVEETHTKSLGFIFSKDGKSCTVETGLSDLFAANRISLYVIYSPETSTVILTESQASSRTEYQGVIEGERMKVQDSHDWGREITLLKRK